jgi:hypothetical protein
VWNQLWILKSSGGVSHLADDTVGPRGSKLLLNALEFLGDNVVVCIAVKSQRNLPIFKKGLNGAERGPHNSDYDTVADVQRNRGVEAG